MQTVMTPRGKEVRSMPRNAAKTRADIINAAIHVFAENGYEGATLDAIARRARYSKRMIYYFYVDKADLYDSVVAECWASFESEIIGFRSHAKRTKPEVVIRSLATAMFAFKCSNPTVTRLLHHDVTFPGSRPGASHRYEHFRAIALEVLRDAHARGVAAGRFGRSPTPETTFAMLDALSSYEVARKKEGREEPAALGGRLIDTLLRGMVRTPKVNWM